MPNFARFERTNKRTLGMNAILTAKPAFYGFLAQFSNGQDTFTSEQPNTCFEPLLLVSSP